MPPGKRLRSGYTTGACAAAAAKAATRLLLGAQVEGRVAIPFPDGSRHDFAVHASALEEGLARASVIKDAGDDPDVTNGAEIVVEARRVEGGDEGGDGAVVLRGGAGVGRVTKPGLAVAVGEPAINPVPRRMIRAAVAEAVEERGGQGGAIEIRVIVPQGEELAKKTLNHRLGIVGGLSILGTTGIVRPVSAEAWTATIESSMRVARAAGLDEIVLSTGRTSERGVQALLDLPEEAYAMMGDYLAFSLQAAARLGFGRIHLAAMWAKILKAAMAIPQTHVRHGALDPAQALDYLRGLGIDPVLGKALEGANTAREIREGLRRAGRDDLVLRVCREAAAYAYAVSGLEVRVYLVNQHAEVEAHV